MLGIIITGHGQFAIGVKNALELIAGENDRVKSVCFLGDESYDDLMIRLREEATELLEHCNQVMFVCDISGGTPFKAAVTLVQESESTGVISPINLPILLDLSLSDFEGLSTEAIYMKVTESEMIKPQYFGKLEAKDQVNDEMEDGI